MGDDPAAVSEARVYDEAVGTFEETSFAEWTGNRQEGPSSGSAHRF